MNVELPEASSLQRTNTVMRKIDEILKHEPGIRYYNAIAGFSILSQTSSSSRSGLYFCLLTPYDQRQTAALQAGPVVASVNRKLAGLPDAQAFAFLPPAIPGIGQASGVDFFVQDHSGNTVDYLWQNTQKFLAAARKRPEMARMNLTFSPAVPQMFAAVDKDKVFKLGVTIESVYAALRTLLGGYYVNQFNRFGRVWKVFVEAEPRVSRAGQGRRPVLRDQQPGRDGSALDPGRYAARIRTRNTPRGSTSIAASKSSPPRRPATAPATR